MLKQLLHVKRSRERSLRQSLIKLTNDDKMLSERLSGLRERLQALHKEWRSLADRSGRFDQRGLEMLRASLSRLDSANNSLNHELETLLFAREQVAKNLAKQRLLLRHTLLEQEKLLLLLDVAEDRAH